MHYLSFIHSFILSKHRRHPITQHPPLFHHAMINVNVGIPTGNISLTVSLQCADAHTHSQFSSIVRFVLSPSFSLSLPSCRGVPSGRHTCIPSLHVHIYLRREDGQRREIGDHCCLNERRRSRDADYTRSFLLSLPSSIFFAERANTPRHNTRVGF